MSTGHDDTAGREEVARLSRRGFLRTAVTTAAVVGTSSALAAPALAQDSRLPGPAAATGSHATRSASSCSPCATSWPSTWRAPSPPWPRSATPGSSTPASSAAPSPSSRRRWTPPGCESTSGHVLIPQPFDPAAWSASLADANTLGSRYIVHPFFGINFGTGEVTRTTAPWQAFARDMNRAGRMARDAGLKLGYHNHNWEFFRLTDDPSRTAYDVLTDTTDPDLVHLELDLFWATRGARDPVDLIKENQGPGPAVPRQGHEPGRQLRRSRSGPARLRPDLPATATRPGCASTSSSVTTPAARRGSPPTRSTTARVGYQFLRTIRF